MRIYTKAGDAGETGLLFGGRVSKSDSRCEAYGSTDEAVSAMGLARSLCKSRRVQEILPEVQREMFAVGAELATSADHRHHLEANVGVINADMVDRLESLIDELSAGVELPPAFIVPGASPGSAALDLARSLLRTAERRTVALREADMLPNVEVLRYLNRLSDLLFMLARYEDRDLPFELSTGEELPPGGRTD